MKEQSYPEGIYTKINISLTFNPSDGVYQIYCPEWKFESYSTDPDRVVMDLVREISFHNKAEIENGV